MLKKHVAIIGAGMGGCLMGLFLAQEKFQIDIYESRNDIRNLPDIFDKSINQSLSMRGVSALKQVHIWKKVQKLTMREEGRVIHQKEGGTHYQPYGEKQHLCEWSINRNDLNKVLLAELEKKPNIQIHFQWKCRNIDISKKTLVLQDIKTGKIVRKKIDFIIGADGIHSSVRKALVKEGLIKEKLKYLEWGYKNIYIHKAHNKKLPFKSKAFHLWSRRNAAIFGILNVKGFFTCTLALPLQGKISFSSIETKTKLLTFFQKYFPDLALFMKFSTREFHKKNVTPFTSLYVRPWYYKDNIVLLGDAAHALTIFYGQGINAAFEDCKNLMECIKQYAPNYEKAFVKYQSLRKPNTDVLARLSEQRFIELTDKYESNSFIAKRTIEMYLERFFPNKWYSLYTLVVHTTLPYAVALRRYKRQTQFGKLIGLDFISAIYSLFFLRKKQLQHKNR